MALPEEESRKLSLLERLGSIAREDENVVHVAVRTLTTRDEMGMFLREYSNFLKDNSDNPQARNEPEEVAKREIIGATVDFPYQVLQRWDQLFRGVEPLSLNVRPFKKGKGMYRV